VQTFGSHELSLGVPRALLVAVRVAVGFADGIVGHAQLDEFALLGGHQLVSLTGLEEEGISATDRVSSSLSSRMKPSPERI